jgi:hypothetical protein
MDDAVAAASIARIRAICAALPECTVDGDQHHKIAVRAKTMAWHTVDHHGDGRVSLAVKAPRGENAARVAADPERYFMPPYVAQHGYVGIHLDTGDVDWDEVAELLVESYRLSAPKTLVKQLDE